MKISKNRFNSYDGQAGFRTSEKNISAIWRVEQFDIGQLGCGSSLVQHSGNSKFLDNLDVGPATTAHLNGCTDACKCTEIFKKNLYSRVP